MVETLLKACGPQRHSVGDAKMPVSTPSHVRATCMSVFVCLSNWFNNGNFNHSAFICIFPFISFCLIIYSRICGFFLCVCVFKFKIVHAVRSDAKYRNKW